MSERRERGGGTKRRRRGIGGKEEEGTLLNSFAPPPTSEPWQRHWLPQIDILVVVKGVIWFPCVLFCCNDLIYFKTRRIEMHSVKGRRAYCLL